MRKMFILFSTSAAKRLTFKQRSKFINYIGKELLNNNVKCYLDKYSNKMDKGVSLVVGNLRQAKRVIVAGYDTPRKMLFSKFMYYPLNWEKNRTQEKKNIIIVFIISMIATVLCGIALCYSKFLRMQLRLVLYFFIALTMALIIKLNKGYVNFYNFNKNTGAVTILFNLALNFGGSSNKTAYVFLDKTAESYEGYERLKKLLEKCNNKKAEVIILDCIAEGEKTYAAFNEKNETDYNTLIKKMNKHIDLELLKLNEEQYANTFLRLYSKGILIFCGKEEKDEYVVENLRTGRDSQCDLDKLNNMYKALADLIKE